MSAAPVRFLHRLARDERGDAVQVVIVAALIFIPLVMALIYFGSRIQGWLSDAFQQLLGKG